MVGSGPEPIEVGEGQFSLEVIDIVPHVQNKAAVVASVLDAAQTSTDHLEVEVGTVYRPSDYDGPSFRCIEPLPEYP